ncbi:MAG: 16S rRNA (guanine(527)-N(7))-methyltransferase RsmG [Pedobacter sp.]|jgi:16S rRNA (guanine527-N7)-methyltransferase
MTYFNSDFKIYVDSLSAEGLSPEHIFKFDMYLQLILNNSAKHNITGFKNPGDIVDNLFIDTLRGIKGIIFENNMRIIDIGTGAGIPSIPIKLIHPSLHLTLNDSTQKKCSFLSYTLKKLNLSDSEVICERSETLAHKNSYRESFDIAFARALAPLPTLLELCLPFIKINGRIIAYKGRQIEEEIALSKNALLKLGGNIDDIVWYTPENIEKKHCIVIITKKFNTPNEYPRKPGIPEKRPL